MDTPNFSALSGASSDNRFALGRKWFWMGIVMSLFFSAPGLLYGIALLFEKENRKSGIVIITFAVVWYIALSLFLAWLTVSGYLPRYQVLQFSR